MKLPPDLNHVPLLSVCLIKPGAEPLVNQIVRVTGIMVRWGDSWAVYDPRCQDGFLYLKDACAYEASRTPCRFPGLIFEDRLEDLRVQRFGAMVEIVVELIPSESPIGFYVFGSVREIRSLVPLHEPPPPPPIMVESERDHAC